MSHSRFALGFTRHRKVARLSDAAFRLWVSCVDYAREQATDGYLDPADLDVVPRCPPAGSKRDNLLTELIEVSLLEPLEHGWRLHDFLDWQDSALQVNEKARRARERMREVRANTGPLFARTHEERSLEVRPTDHDPPLGSNLSDPSGASPDLPEKPGSARVRASGGRRTKAPMRPIPDNFELSAKHLDHTAKKAWPAWWVSDRFEVFCGLAKAKSWQYAEWDAALYTFLRNEIGYRRGPEDLPPPKGTPPASAAARPVWRPPDAPTNVAPPPPNPLRRATATPNGAEPVAPDASAAKPNVAAAEGHG